MSFLKFVILVRSVICISSMFSLSLGSICFAHFCFNDFVNHCARARVCVCVIQKFKLIKKDLIFSSVDIIIIQVIVTK